MTTELGLGGGASTWCDYIAAIAPDGDLVFVWDHALLRDWKVFNVTAATGHKVRPPELPWWGGAGSHLVFGGAG